MMSLEKLNNLWANINGNNSSICSYEKKIKAERRQVVFTVLGRIRI